GSRDEGAGAGDACRRRRLRRLGRAPMRELQHLGQVERAPSGALLDLRLAREPVRDDEDIAVAATNRREERAFAARDGDVVVAFLVAPGAGHAAAAAVRALDIEAHLLEQLPKRLEARRRLLVTVAVHERAALELRRLVAVAAEELGEVERLLAQALHVLVLRHELRCFVLQYRDAARLDADDRRAGADLLAKRTEHTFEVAPREVEHPVVVERPPATELRARDRHVVA